MEEERSFTGEIGVLALVKSNNCRSLLCAVGKRKLPDKFWGLFFGVFLGQCMGNSTQPLINKPEFILNWKFESILIKCLG